jgi:hypothetical protein
MGGIDGRCTMKSLILRPRKFPGSVLVVLATALAVLVTSPAPIAQQRGRCAVTELPGHLVLPDGTVHDSGELKICFEDWHNPSSGRHVILLDGKKWGYLLSRSGRSDKSRTDVPVFVFTPRTEHQHVRLLGYAWPDGDGMSIHVLHRPGRKVPRSLVDVSSLLERAAEERLVLVSARAE